MTPVALTIAGSDSSGGAGIQADLKTFSALGVYGASAITALTAQNTLGVQGVMAVPPEFVAAQIASVLADLDVGAIKIGMLANAAVVGAVAEALRPHPGMPIVLDPVMVAASGDPLLAADAVAALRTRLMPMAALVTPNLPEAGALLGSSPAGSEAEALAQGRALLELGAAAVLMKGGHAEGPESVDLLVRAEGYERFAAERIPTRNVHGTGCTLSSAVAAGLAKGLPLDDAVAAAKRYVTAAIAASERLGVGRGHGPGHHFHAWW